MSVTRLVTPAELRLAVLLFLLGAIGVLFRTAGSLSPEVEEWLRDEVSPARGDSISGVLAGGADPAPDPPPDPAPDPAPGGAGPSSDQSGVDPSTASLSVLRTLPGVGPVLAARIIEDRTRNGPFRTPEDLLRVKGIGRATLERIRGNLVFSSR